ncbi:MAG: NADH-quinone oxidoreductase subunit NuoE [Desulfobacterales bacterium]|nr:NADH-quinone oxidoreductase subunit NuoE [Desulfobacterales bacterium]
MMGELQELLTAYPAQRRSLLRILQAVQKKIGYLPEEALEEVGRYLKVSPAEVYGVATFYNQFRFIPYGKHRIVACQGTACHAMGGQLVLDAFERELDVKAGGITLDHGWSLDRVGCIGCCTKAPVAVINDIISAKLTPFKVEEVLAGLGLERNKGSEDEEAGEGESQ